MRYGDKEGLGVVYSDDGTLVLSEGEKILAKETNVIPSLKTTWRIYGGETLISSVKGDIYLTTDRLVFIGEKEDVYLIGREGARTAQEFDGLGLRSLSGGGVRDFFDVPNIEIMGVNRKTGVILSGEFVYIYILSQGKQYHIQIMLRSNSPLLKRLLNKEVPSVDDLVQNLKKYFQMTDWMFTESEKAAWKEAIERRRVEAEKMGIEQGILASAPSPEETVKPTVEEKKKIDGLTVEYFRKLLEKGLISPQMYEKLTGEKPPQVLKEEIPTAKEVPQAHERPAPRTGTPMLKKRLEVSGQPVSPAHPALQKGDIEQKEPFGVPEVPSVEERVVRGMEPSVVSKATSEAGSGEGPPPTPITSPADLEKMLLETIELTGGGGVDLAPPPPPPSELEIPEKKNGQETSAENEPLEKEGGGEGEPKKKVKAKKLILKIKKPR